MVDSKNALDKSLTNKHPACPVMYFLLKTYKLDAGTLHLMSPTNYEVRPIVSECDGPMDRIFWFLCRVLVLALKTLPSCIYDSASIHEQPPSGIWKH